MKLLTFLALVVTDILLCQGKVDNACGCESDLLVSLNANSISKSWRLAFRGTANIGIPVLPAYMNGTGILENVDPHCKMVKKPWNCASHYRNNEVFDNWNTVSEVAFVVYSNYTVVKEILFDAVGSTYMNWFDKSRVKFSSWDSLNTATTNFFSIKGETQFNDTVSRTFYINRNYGGCPADAGWFVVIDRANGKCGWEKFTTFPVFKYADSYNEENWTNGKVAYADVMAVYVNC
ncbi:uncharacterized protein LOC131936540 [Physella acuta]|uniref:uncharacterized protein LOC131936540 n=1 Tax=Physella acuta TaxID=109671 RepID=UPI0027DE9C1A|nr:uncharacterized protein LOC131936540 [Physella acuta]